MQNYYSVLSEVYPELLHLAQCPHNSLSYNRITYSTRVISRDIQLISAYHDLQDFEFLLVYDNPPANLQHISFDNTPDIGVPLHDSLA